MSNKTIIQTLIKHMLYNNTNLFIYYNIKINVNNL